MKKLIRNKTYLIAGGNRTSLVWNCPKNKRLEISNKLLSSVEQVGFVDLTTDTAPYLAMMGNELCINAILALAYALSGTGCLYTSGTNNSVQFTNSNKLATITLPLKYTRIDDVIIFEGIGFLCTTKDIIPKKSELKALAKKYNLPAFGYAVYTKNVLKPYVFVRDVNSFVLETACGSGSIATTITTGVGKITQLSGETIRIKILQNTVTVTAKVTEDNTCKITI